MTEGYLANLANRLTLARDEDKTPVTMRPPVAIRYETPPSLEHGPYRMEEVIGRGGMAVVHVARRASGHDTGERFAVKRILPEFARSPSFVRMLCREARLGRKLDHRNVVRVVDFGEQDGDLLLVTEYVDGTSCGRMLRTVAERGERVPVEVALYIACEVLDALDYTHRAEHPLGSPLRVVHRDVSPGNILLGAMGEVKLADFGVARCDDGMRDTCPGTLKGKLGYMSPEQVDGGPIDGRSDLFSLAVVTLEMLTGTPFFVGKDDFEILARMHEGTLSPLTHPRARALPLELRLVLATALAQDRGERFEDAHEFARALRSVARHVGLTVDRRGLVSWLRRFDVWPVRSGMYPAVHAPLALDSSGAERNTRGAKASG